MARSFTSSSSQYLIATQSVITEPPISLSGWGRPTVTNENNAIVCLGQNGSDDRVWIYFRQGKIRVAQDAGNFKFAETTGSYSANNWYHVGATINGTTDRKVFALGEVVQDTTNSNITGGLNRCTIGDTFDSFNGHENFMQGRLAEIGVWNAILTTAEMNMLALGYSPLLIRPQNLVIYVPLVRNNDNDLINGLGFTTSASAPGVQINGAPLFQQVKPFYPGPAPDIVSGEGSQMYSGFKSGMSSGIII
jgi:hypothetical protein